MTLKIKQKVKSLRDILNIWDINRFKTIFIEPAYNICNLHCLYCPIGLKVKLIGVSKGFLTLDNLKKICLESLKKYKGNISLYNWGEPFLNPEFPEIIKYLKDNTKASLILNSNFSFSNDKLMIRVLQLLDGDTIIISCDGFSQETCARHRVNVDFKKIMHNIDLMIKNRPPNTKIAWQYLEFSWNMNELESAKEYCQQNEIIFYSGIGGTNSRYPVLPCPKSSNQKRFRCDFFFDSLTINFDGEVYPCCTYYGPKKYSLGNATVHSLKDIFTKYKGKEMVDYLSYKTDGNHSIFCKHCIEKNSKELITWEI